MLHCNFLQSMLNTSLMLIRNTFIIDILLLNQFLNIYFSFTFAFTMANPIQMKTFGPSLIKVRPLNIINLRQILDFISVAVNLFNLIFFISFNSDMFLILAFRLSSFRVRRTETRLFGYQGGSLLRFGFGFGFENGLVLVSMD